MKNWKTSAAGVGAILCAIGSALGALSAGTPVDYTPVIVAIIAGVGLIMAHNEGLGVPLASGGAFVVLIGMVIFAWLVFRGTKKA